MRHATPQSLSVVWRTTGTRRGRHPDSPGTLRTLLGTSGDRAARALARNSLDASPGVASGATTCRDATVGCLLTPTTPSYAFCLSTLAGLTERTSRAASAAAASATIARTRLESVTIDAVSKAPQS